MEEYVKHLKCGLCLDFYENPYELSCSHSFCKKCIDKGLKENEQFCCSTCQAVTNYEDIKPNCRINEFIHFLNPLQNHTSSKIRCGVFDENIDHQDSLHGHHHKTSTEERKELLKADISETVDKINLRIKELKSFKTYSINSKRDVEQRFNDLDLKVRERRDCIVNQANEAYENQKNLICVRKLDLIKKIEANIETIETFETKMSRILKYANENLTEESDFKINEIKQAVNENSMMGFNFKFSYVGIEMLQLNPVNLDEEVMRQNIDSYIGDIDLKVQEKTTTDISNCFLYEHVVQPCLVSNNASQSALADVLYDQENDAIFSVKTVNGKSYINKISMKCEVQDYIIKNCWYKYRRNYLAMLPSRNILVLCYSDDETSDRLIEVDNDVANSKEFPIAFCEPKDLTSICSSPCKKFVIFLSEKLLTVYKYCVHTKQSEKANLPQKLKNCYLSYICLSENLDHLVLGHFNEIHLFSFENEAILRSFGASHEYYRGVSFLTENILIAGLKDCSLNIFDVTDGKLLRKIKRIKVKDHKDYEIEDVPHLVYACNDSIVTFNQDCDILKISLK